MHDNKFFTTYTRNLEEWLPNSSNCLPVTVLSWFPMMRQRQCRIFLAFSQPEIFGALNKNTIYLLHCFVYLLSLFGCRTQFFTAKFVWQTHRHPERHLLSPGPSKLFRMNHNLINGFSELCIINGSLRSYCQVLFIGDVYFGKIGERAETLINIHQHMHFLLCTLWDKKDIKKC